MENVLTLVQTIKRWRFSQDCQQSTDVSHFKSKCEHLPAALSSVSELKINLLASENITVSVCFFAQTWPVRGNRTLYLSDT